jgi:hypothetical protein
LYRGFRKKEENMKKKREKARFDAKIVARGKYLGAWRQVRT